MKGHRSATALALLTLAAGLLALLVLPSTRPAESQVSGAPPRAVGAPTTVVATTVVPAVEATPTSSPPLDVPAEVVAEPVAPPPEATPAAPAGPRKVMLIGDSMAFTASLGLAAHAPNWNLVVANEGINGCGVVRGGPYRYFGAQRDMEPRCEAWPTAWQDALARNHPVDLVAIVIGRWELMDRVFEGRWTNLFDPAFAAYVESEVDAAVTLAASTGARVVVFTTPYYRRGIPPGGGLYPEDDPARVDTMNAILRRVAERHAAAVIDVGGRLSPGGTYTRDVDGIRVRSDGVHLTRQAGDVLGPWLFPQLDVILSTPPPAPPAAPVPRLDRRVA